MAKQTTSGRREALLARCRFYKGEASCPAGVKFLCWEVEEVWVSSVLSGDSSFLDAAVASFRQLVPAEPLYKDGTPVAVQALLFERYCHSSDVDPLLLGLSFSRFYANNWLARPR